MIRIIVFLLALLSYQSYTYGASPQIGLFTGLSLVQNADFNNQNTKTKAHFTVGVKMPFQLSCQNRFCNGLFLEPSFAFSFPANSRFGSTTIANTGQTGSYSESLKIYTGQLVLKKYFELKGKTTFFASSGIGVSYFDLSNINYQDALGQEIPLNISQNAMNAHFNLGLGIAHEISPNFLIHISVEPYLVVPSGLKQSYLMIPVGVNYSF